MPICRKCGKSFFEVGFPANFEACKDCREPAKMFSLTSTPVPTCQVCHLTKKMPAPGKPDERVCRCSQEQLAGRRELQEKEEIIRELKTRLREIKHEEKARYETSLQKKDQQIANLQEQINQSASSASSHSDNQLAQTHEQTIQQLRTDLTKQENILTKTKEQLTQSQTKIQELKQNLTNTLKSLQDLQTENKNLHNQTEQKRQTILTLEADKQDLIQQLSQTKQKHHSYLNQTKQQIAQEITLIKEALHD